MNSKTAIIAFSQSEKIKSGIIWVSHIVELINGLSEIERQGAEKAATALVNMIGQDILLARKIAPHVSWEKIDKHIEKAVVMLNSGVAAESITHLTQALSRVTDIGQDSMRYLMERKLL